MTAEIVNLRRARKAKKRADDAGSAAANRAAFGVSRTAKDAQAAEQNRLARQLDAHLLSDDGGRDA